MKNRGPFSNTEGYRETAPSTEIFPPDFVKIICGDMRGDWWAW